MIDLASEIWHDTIRTMQSNSNLKEINAIIPKTWTNKLTPDVIKSLEDYGKSLGFITQVKQGTFYWLIASR